MNNMKLYTLNLTKEEVELLVYILDAKSEEIGNFDDEGDDEKVCELSDKLYSLINPKV